MNPPLVSVIMSVYNAEKFLHSAIESITNQTFTDFEFIIIEDCSTDKTLEIYKIADYKIVKSLLVLRFFYYFYIKILS